MREVSIEPVKKRKMEEEKNQTGLMKPKTRPSRTRLTLHFKTFLSFINVACTEANSFISYSPRHWNYEVIGVEFLQILLLPVYDQSFLQEKTASTCPAEQPVISET